MHTYVCSLPPAMCCNSRFSWNGGEREVISQLHSHHHCKWHLKWVTQLSNRTHRFLEPNEEASCCCGLPYYAFFHSSSALGSHFRRRGTRSPAYSPFEVETNSSQPRPKREKKGAIGLPTIFIPLSGFLFATLIGMRTPGVRAMPYKEG